MKALNPRKKSDVPSISIVEFYHISTQKSIRRFAAGINDAPILFDAAGLSVSFETALLHIQQAKNAGPKHTIISEGRQIP